MPNKERRRRMKEQQDFQQSIDTALSRLPPDHIIALKSDGKNEFDCGSPRGGLVQCIGDDISLHPNIGKGGNLSRENTRREDAQDLKRRYKTTWGERGKAKTIAIENGLSERTVQKYFKDFP